MHRADGRTLGRSPVHHRLNAHRQTSTRAHIHTYGQFRVSTLPDLHVFECGRKPQKKPTQTCKLGTGRAKDQTWVFSLWGDSVNPYTDRPVVVTIFYEHIKCGGVLLLDMRRSLRWPIKCMDTSALDWNTVGAENALNCDQHFHCSLLGQLFSQFIS